MSERRAKGCLLAAMIWCVILVVLAVGYKFLVHPYLSERLRKDTGSESQYDHEVAVAADSFSGYSVLRSDIMRDDLRAQRIKLTIEDDGADYEGRFKALRRGDVQMAVFTVDSLITAGAGAGDMPGTIVLVIDETKGGDAIVADRNALPSLQDLNDPEARIVLTRASPSEFLARVVIAHFNLPRLPADWIVEADGAEDAYKMLRGAGTGEKRAYVLWEPYVSKALERPGVHLLLDSSKLKGYIVDVLVARREFLRDHPELVKKVLESYFRAAFHYAREPDGMVELVQSDAKRTGAESLDPAQARKIVEGVQWKNTLENYAHFGLSAQSGLPVLEDVVANIVDVLVKTGALASDPLDGQHHTLYYDKVLRQMRADNFHPGRGLNLIEGLESVGGELERVRVDSKLEALSAAQWERLQPVGELRVEPVVFSRMSAKISVQSERDLRELARRLESFPRYYLRIIGHTRTEGDPEANRALAQSRADAAADFLTAQGIDRTRLKAEAGPTSVGGGEAQAVSFMVGQTPY